LPTKATPFKPKTGFEALQENLARNRSVLASDPSSSTRSGFDESEEREEKEQ
jgi:hypothetical protein